MDLPKTKKSFKLNVLGVIKWESDEWAAKEVALILGMVMAFILILIILLKALAISSVAISAMLGTAWGNAGKIFNGRTPK